MFISKEAEKDLHQFKDLAQAHADAYSGCTKVAVGAVIVSRGEVVAKGCNITMPYMCKEEGCHRVLLYGENSDKHRMPHECLALHAEINAITSAARQGKKTEGATIIVTRYPCEACARAIVSAGIRKVHYFGQQMISEQTEAIFSDNNVDYYFWEEVHK